MLHQSPEDWDEPALKLEPPLSVLLPAALDGVAVAAPVAAALEDAPAGALVVAALLPESAACSDAP